MSYKTMIIQINMEFTKSEKSIIISHIKYVKFISEKRHYELKVHEAYFDLIFY